MMCGIIGLLNIRESSGNIAVLIDGLKKLEYRGYDSWGYAFIDNNAIKLEKKAGRIQNPLLNGNSRILIGHTRWATHGGVTDANAHPHLDCKGNIAVVHNGIIENYVELRQQLIAEGHKFKSQTDSEVISHLFEKASGDLLSRAKQVAHLLRGSFALVAMSTESKDELVAIKNESPLVVGIGACDIVFSSDPLAFPESVSDMVLLGEGDIAFAKIVENNVSMRYFNYASGLDLKKEPKNLNRLYNWTEKDIHLGKYSHYMLKEIMEQPVRMQDMLSDAGIQSARSLAKAMKNRKVIAIACGSARHAAVIGKHVLHRIAGFSIDVMMAHEFSYFINDIDKDTLILAVSQSGETADVMECVRKAKSRGIKVYSVVNAPSSSLARESEETYYINCGPEIAVASTKAFSNQVLAFYLIAYALAGRIDEEAKHIQFVISALNSSLSYFDAKAREIAKYLETKQHVYMLGKGIHFPIALEGSLKLKEISYIHAEGMPAGELKHGTLALIEDGTPVILLCPSGYNYNDSISNGLETKARGAYLIGISDKPHHSFNVWLQLPELSQENEVLYPLLETIPLQLIAYHTAVLLKRDVDKPRNLAKSVTVK